MKNKPITILPSPDPMSSSRGLTFPTSGLPNTDIIFSTCCVVAGTYGRQCFLKAGATNGAHITLRPIAIPPKTKKK